MLLVAVRLRLVGGLGGRRRQRHARRRSFTDEGDGQGFSEVPIPAARCSGWRWLEPVLQPRQRATNRFARYSPQNRMIMKCLPAPGSRGSGAGSVGGGSHFQSVCGGHIPGIWVLVRRQPGRWRSGCSTVSAAKTSRLYSERRPRRVTHERGDDLVGLAMKTSERPGSDELLGRKTRKSRSLLLDGVEQPGSRVAECSQQRGG